MVVRVGSAKAASSQVRSSAENAVRRHDRDPLTEEPMNKPRLLYFDFAGSRGEECRIALHLAGVDFEDVRLANADWKAMKATSPFGSMPILELPGKPPLGQSNAILCLIGRRHGLHPADDFEAARHEALLNYAEELRQHIAPTLRIADPEQKRVAREELAKGYLNDWGTRVERQIGDGPFLAGETLQVADIKLYMIVRWFATGTVDHVPGTVFDHCPKLKRLYAAVAEHPGVKTWLSRAAR
jgi:glutathione S-transferase